MNQTKAIQRKEHTSQTIIQYIFKIWRERKIEDKKLSLVAWYKYDRRTLK